MIQMNRCPTIVVFDIDGVLRDVSGSYRRALADTVQHFTQAAYRPTEEDIDALKREGCWNNDWEGSQELIYRHFEQNGLSRSKLQLDYDALVDFFQKRYRGDVLEDPEQWNGYITQEPLLVNRTYFETLTQSQIAWGFFSGATKGSATFILQKRLGLEQPTLIAMEDAPGKPDPTGLFKVVEALTQQFQLTTTLPVVYVGDTVADMQTVMKAKHQQPHRPWIAVGVLPPHVRHHDANYIADFRAALIASGGHQVFDAVDQITPALLSDLIKNKVS